MRTRAVTIVGLALALVLATSAPADASSKRLTRGDAVALFEAFGNAGLNLFVKGNVVGAPVQTAGRIEVFQAPGRAYCTLDWLDPQLSLVGGSTPEEPLSTVEVRAQFAGATVEFVLDGAPLTTQMTAIKRLNQPQLLGVDWGFWRNVGTLVAPGSLALGSHELSAVIHQQDGDQLFATTFIVDAAGTGACL